MILKWFLLILDYLKCSWMILNDSQIILVILADSQMILKQFPLILEWFSSDSY